MRGLRQGDVIRVKTSTFLWKDYELDMMAKRIRAAPVLENRLFKNNMVNEWGCYVYSLLYLIVDIDNQHVVHVRRLDQHRKYMQSPYTIVGLNYLSKGKLVREGVDVSSITFKRHPHWGYSGCLENKLRRLQQAPTSNGPSCG